MKSGAEESYLTVAEIAAVLKVNQQTVRNWIEGGKLPALRIGRRVRVKKSDLNQLLNASYTGSHPAPVPSAAAQVFWEGELLPEVGPDPPSRDTHRRRRRMPSRLRPAVRRSQGGRAGVQNGATA